MTDSKSKKYLNRLRPNFPIENPPNTLEASAPLRVLTIISAYLRVELATLSAATGGTISTLNKL